MLALPFTHKSPFSDLWVKGSASVHHRDGRPRASPAQRVSCRREPDPEGADQGSVFTVGRGKKKTLVDLAYRLGRIALEAAANAAKPETILGWYR